MLHQSFRGSVIRISLFIPSTALAGALEVKKPRMKLPDIIMLQKFTMPTGIPGCRKPV